MTDVQIGVWVFYPIASLYAYAWDSDIGIIVFLLYPILFFMCGY